MRLYIAFCVHLLFITALNSEPIKIISLLNEGRISELEAIRDSVQGVEKLFLEAVFEAEGVEAAQKYEQIIANYPDHSLASEARTRLDQYYRMKGADSKPVEVQEEKINTVITDTVALSPVVEKRYWIQVGAFGDRENVRKLVLSFKSKGYGVEIVEKVIKGRALQVVRVGGYADYSQALVIKERIEAEFGLKTRLVEGSP